MTMRKSGAILTPVLLSLGLAACGQNPATTENITTETSGAETENSKAQDATIAAETAKVTMLPLKRGFYVSSDTPCGQSSNATTSLLDRTGIGGSRSYCTFEKIEKTGPDTYRVTESCGDLQDDAPSETGITTYTLTGDTRFTSKNATGWEHSARYCPQASMSPDFRENDISDATN